MFCLYDLPQGAVLAAMLLLISIYGIYLTDYRRHEGKRENTDVLWKIVREVIEEDVANICSGLPSLRCSLVTPLILSDEEKYLEFAFTSDSTWWNRCPSLDSQRDDHYNCPLNNLMPRLHHWHSLTRKNIFSLLLPLTRYAETVTHIWIYSETIVITVHWTV